MYVVDNDSDRTKRDYLLFTSKFIERALDAAFDTEQNKYDLKLTEKILYSMIVMINRNYMLRLL